MQAYKRLPTKPYQPVSIIITIKKKEKEGRTVIVMKTPYEIRFECSATL